MMSLGNTSSKVKSKGRDRGRIKERSFLFFPFFSFFTSILSSLTQISNIPLLQNARSLTQSEWVHKRQGNKPIMAHFNLFSLFVKN